MRRTIRRVAVLGAGVMGSRIACHFANIGVEVLLLDRLFIEDNENTDDPKNRNFYADSGLGSALKTGPSPLFDASFASKITTGNFEDNLSEISAVDWVVEVILEDLSAKQLLYEQIEQHRAPGTLISSNTSGIPIAQLIAGRSEDFVAHFCGTHFFNPPRYLPLLEVIPSKKTLPEVVDFLRHYGELFLGKTTLQCKDTPGFIANRIGVFALLTTLRIAQRLRLSIEAVDALSGTLIGRPKSATFRTADVVGVDTLAKVAKGLYENLPNDEAREVFLVPQYIDALIDKGLVGEKVRAGFYKRIKTADEKSEILVLDVPSLSYKNQEKPSLPTLDAIKGIDSLESRLQFLNKGKDVVSQFFKGAHFPLFSYVSFRIPEISDSLFQIDNAIRAGFGWSLGPFEIWDVLGVKNVVEQINTQPETKEVAAWVMEMLGNGFESFYSFQEGRRVYYDPLTKAYQPIPQSEGLVQLSARREKYTLWKNGDVRLVDLGDGILNVELQTKMNTITGDVLHGINYALDLAEREYKGLVIGGEGVNFSAGANLGLIFMLAVEQEMEELDLAVRLFQQTSMRIRYSKVPVVVAAFGLTLGGACEMAMHADFVQMYAETYMGLVEFGVGIIPAGGGTKEFALRAGDEFTRSTNNLNVFRERFLTIGQAKVSGSAYQAVELGFVQPGKYGITMNRDRLLSDAKRQALNLWNAGYAVAQPRKDVRVLGNAALGLVYAGANAMQAAGYISPHDHWLSEKLGWVMAGGELSEPAAVSEQYLLDLEREIFLELVTSEKSIERIQFMLTKGKPLRN